MFFCFYAPTRIMFGELNFETICSQLSDFGSKIMVLSGGTSTTLIANTIVNMLSNKFDVTLKSGVQSNPLSTFVEQVIAEEDRPNAIISVGGGSVHDTAKVLSVLFTHKGSVEQYLTDGEYGTDGIKDNVLPVITIPTIFGTGSEISPAALIRINNQKKMMYSPFLHPKIAYIVPRLAISVPPAICKYCALDAFVQGVESYVSQKSQDFSHVFSLSAITRVLKVLPSIEYNGMTVKDLEQLALAAIESVYAVCQSSVGAVHAISNPLSGIYNIHHGKAVGILLPYVAEVNYPYAAPKYDELKKIINTTLCFEKKSIRESIEEFYKVINFDTYSEKEKLIKTGILRNLSECVSDSFNKDMEGNPFEMDSSTIRSIIQKLKDKKR